MPVVDFALTAEVARGNQNSLEEGEEEGGIGAEIQVLIGEESQGQLQDSVQLRRSELLPVGKLRREGKGRTPNRLGQPPPT